MNWLYSLVVCSTLFNPLTLFAQNNISNSPSANGDEPEVVVTSSRMFDQFGNINWESLLVDNDVNEILEITEDQKESLFSVMARATGERNRLLLQTFGDGNESEQQIRQGVEGRSRLTQQFSLQFQSEIGAVLLPHQVNKLNQIAMERALSQNMGEELLDGILSSSGIETSDKEIKELVRRIKVEQRELEAEVSKLRLDAWKDLLSDLNGSQKRAVQKRFEIGKGMK